MTVQRILTAGLIGGSLLVTSASHAVADQAQGAFGGIDTLLQSTEQTASETSPDVLNQQANALAADIATFRNAYSDVSQAKLVELAHVVAQLQENIAALSPSSDPGEVAFLGDELVSLRGQFVSFVALLERRSCKNTFAFDQSLINTAVTTPGVATAFPPLLPRPVFGRSKPTTATFELTRSVKIVTTQDDARLDAVASYLNDSLRGIVTRNTGPATYVGAPCILLELRDIKKPDGTPVGAEAYTLNITSSGVAIRAATPQGLFYGVQSLLQLLPPQIYDRAGISDEPARWTLPLVDIVDWPRFGYRGVMLDVARHFMSVAEVKRVIDKASLLKVNTFHWHLSDDQGWRIEIPELPELTNVGGRSEVDSAPDPEVNWYYTQQDYKDVVAYAAERFMTVVPEIDGPGHTTAAKAAYAGLNCDNVSPAVNTTTNVGLPGLCLTDPNLANTRDFLNKLWSNLGSISPGPYMHVGGDEAPDAHGKMGVYAEAINIPLAATGKIAMGWHEFGGANNLVPGTVLQFWGTSSSDTEIDNGLRQGAKVLMSPANLSYLDMKYGKGTGDSVGYTWAGLISVEKSYSWDPGKYLRSGNQFVSEDRIIGLEAPLWSETAPQTKSGVSKNDWIDHRMFPRLASYAELGWSPVANRSWAEYKVRLGYQGARWEALGVKFYRSDEQIPWQVLPRTIVLNQ